MIKLFVVNVYIHLFAVSFTKINHTFKIGAVRYPNRSESYSDGIL